MKSRCLSLTIVLLLLAGVALVRNTEAVTANTNTHIAAQSDEKLAEKSGCFECHAIDKNVLGPAYQDIALKYKDDPNARNALIQKVKKGTKGTWTKVSKGAPMPAFSPLLSDAQIMRLVDWVLSLQPSQ